MARLHEYTKEELEVLPMSLLKSIDIRDGEEERVVQEVINRRVVSEPGSFPSLTFSSSATDFMTIEKERELQAKKDEYDHKMRMSVQDESVVEPTPEPVVEPLSEPISEPVPAVEPVLEPVAEPVVEPLEHEETPVESEQVQAKKRGRPRKAVAV